MSLAACPVHLEIDQPLLSSTPALSVSARIIGIKAFRIMDTRCQKETWGDIIATAGAASLHAQLSAGEAKQEKQEGKCLSKS